jgi:hypothetical protein
MVLRRFSTGIYVAPKNQVIDWDVSFPFRSFFLSFFKTASSRLAPTHLDVELSLLRHDFLTKLREGQGRLNLQLWQNQ